MKNTIPFILIPLSIAIIYFYILPEYSTISDLMAQKARYESTIAKTKEMATLRDDLLNQYNAISDADKAKIGHMIPAHFDSTKLISDLSAIAGRHTMTVRSVKVQDGGDVNAGQAQVDVTSGGATVNPYKVATITFVTRGQYQTLLAFLRDIESSEELLDIRKLTIGSAQVAGSSQTFDYSIAVETYYIN